MAAIVVVTTVLTVAIVVALRDQRRLAALRRIEGLDKARLRIGAARHRLVMRAASGEMAESERPAFLASWEAVERDWDAVGRALAEPRHRRG